MLILLEGLPATGKSTNSRFLLTQLERNGRRVRWIHEMARPHPVLFFQEACLTHEEYDAFIHMYPEAKSPLASMAIVREHTVGIDLLQVEWDYGLTISAEALAELKRYDVWSFSLERYKEVALEKWRYFAYQMKQDPELVVILDSALIQFQLFCFQLVNASVQELDVFVQQLFQLLSPLNPTLLYLYREQTEQSIDHLIRCRGESFVERIWNRDKHQPYYQTRPQQPESYKQFLRDYGTIALDLYQHAPCDKKAIELSAGDWPVYEREMLAMFDLERVPDPAAVTTNGTYSNLATGLWLEFHTNHAGQLVLTDPGRKMRTLIPRAEREFYVGDLPVIVRWESEDRVVMTGEQINLQWTTTGMVYNRC